MRQISPEAQRILLSDTAVPGLEAHLNSGLVHRYIAKPVSHEDFAGMLKQ